MGKLYYIMGKSASGKDHIYQDLLQVKTLGLNPIVLYTTRPMREGEVNGREYFFAGEEDLNRLREQGKLIEERCYQTVHGPWYYFTADEGQFHLEEESYLGIGTLESFLNLRKYFGAEKVVPIYIEVRDELRLQRATKREEKQAKPDYEEMKRRFQADARDFSEEKIQQAGIRKRFSNEGRLEETVEKIVEWMQG